MKSRENVLIHYGVLGMKWGVRRYQPYPKGKHGTFLGQTRDEDIRIPKGTKAYRLQSGTELKEGQTYVSFDKVDHYLYVKQTAVGEGGLTIDLEDGKGESVRMVLDRDIVAPSYQATMDAFVKTVSDMEGPKNFAKSAYEKWGKSEYVNRRSKDLMKNLKKMKVDECLDKAYLNFTSTFMSDTKARKIFFDNLKNQGYNAIVDENDKQFGRGMTESPMILFDSSSVKKTSSRTINKQDLDYFNDLFWGGGRDPKKAGFKESKDYWEDFADLDELNRRSDRRYD